MVGLREFGQKVKGGKGKPVQVFNESAARVDPDLFSLAEDGALHPIRVHLALKDFQ